MGKDISYRKSHWRDKLTANISNFLLKHLATKEYRAFISVSYKLGLNRVDVAVRDETIQPETYLMNEEVGALLEVWQYGEMSQETGLVYPLKVGEVPNEEWKARTADPSHPYDAVRRKVRPWEKAYFAK